MKMWGFLNLREHLPVGRPRGIAQLEIEFADGTRQIVATDETWKVAPGPIVRNNIYLGEVYDARRELPGWDRPGFDDAAWAKAAIATEPVGPLQAEMQPPIRVTGKLKPVAAPSPSPACSSSTWARTSPAGRGCGSVGRPARPSSSASANSCYPDGTLNVMTSVCGQIKNGQRTATASIRNWPIKATPTSFPAGATRSICRVSPGTAFVTWR